jgi:hypothetical protein
MAAKSFQVALDGATNENNTEENWDRILGKSLVFNDARRINTPLLLLQRCVTS